MSGGYWLEVWRSSEPRAWERGALHYETAVMCSDGSEDGPFPTRADADARLDDLERLPRVVEVHMRYGNGFDDRLDRHLGAWRRDASGALVHWSRPEALHESRSAS